MSQNNFGPRLKRIRRYRRLTQNDISQLLHISRQAYSNYEQGRCLPPPDTLASLSIILDSNLFLFFIQQALHDYSISSNVQDIPEDEKNILLELYGSLPIESRTIFLEQIIKVRFL
ncbi:MAG: helix-turn-helix domain-containing protein [Wujia sp.]